MEKLLDFLIALCKVILLAVGKLDAARAEKFRADLAASPTDSLLHQLNPNGDTTPISAHTEQPEIRNS